MVLSPFSCQDDVLSLMDNHIDIVIIQLIKYVKLPRWTNKKNYKAMTTRYQSFIKPTILKNCLTQIKNNTL